MVTEHVTQDLCQERHEGWTKLCDEKHRAIDGKLNMVIGTLVTLTVTIVAEIAVFVFMKVAG